MGMGGRYLATSEAVRPLCVITTIRPAQIFSAVLGQGGAREKGVPNGIGGLGGPQRAKSREGLAAGAASWRGGGAKEGRPWLRPQQQCLVVKRLQG